MEDEPLVRGGNYFPGFHVGSDETENRQAGIDEGAGRVGVLGHDLNQGDCQEYAAAKGNGMIAGYPAGDRGLMIGVLVAGPAYPAVNAGQNIEKITQIGQGQVREKVCKDVLLQGLS